MFEDLTRLLDKRSEPLQVFFRDDDGGWANERLDNLCQWFYERRLPLDIAVIPKALDDESTPLLEKWLAVKEADINIHQHGFSHAYHQREGRACEFGSDRNYEQQLHDISNGKEILGNVFGSKTDPVFTPPWNRCTQDTIKIMQTVGLYYLSRISGSTDLCEQDNVRSVDVAVDWLKKRKKIRLENEQSVDYITSCFDTTSTSIGIMLHHEHMLDDELSLLDKFVQVLRDSEKVLFSNMRTTGSDSTSER